MHRAQTIEDRSREGLTVPKLLQPVRLLVPRNNYAHIKVASFPEIHILRINDLLRTEIRGVILDVDECVAPHHGNITPENETAILAMIAAGIRLKVFSNMKDCGRYDDLIHKTEGRIGVHRSKYAKPDPRGFLECCDSMNLLPKNTLMVGDNLMTDGGAIRAGMYFALVQPYPTEENRIQKFKRIPQRSCRWLSRKLSDCYDWLGKRAVLTARDLDGEHHMPISRE